MTDAEVKVHLADRQRRRDIILANLGGYKVCEHCRSISKESAGKCFVCHAYCWETSADAVTEVAHLIASTPFPFTVGTVPRF